MLHRIQYNFVLGERPLEGGVSLVVPDELIDFNLFSLGMYPQNLEHLVIGHRYYKLILNTGDKCGYIVSFIYADSMHLCATLPILPQDETINVFFICTKEVSCLDIIASELRKRHTENSLYVVNNFQKPWFNWQNVFTSSVEALNYLKVLAPRFIDFSKIEDPYFVPDVVKDIDNGYMFNPTVINTLTSHSILGDWNFEVNQFSKEEKSVESQKAFSEKDSFHRQNLILEQMEKMEVIETNSLIEGIFTINEIEQIKAPLILVLPFTNSDSREYIKSLDVRGYKEIQKSISFVLSQTTNHNYTSSGSFPEGTDLNYQTVAVAYQLIYFSRSRFLDIIGQLHASFRFSPYLRLPFQGIEINRELSFVSPKISEELYLSKDKDRIEKTMMNLGELISNNSLSPEMQKYLKNSLRQIVAVSDLPAEWLVIDGIPLGFTHDICRMPEYPMESNLSHYVINEIQNVTIPRDVLKHTLVVYGTSDKTFLSYQDKCNELSETYGYITKRCLTKKDFYDIVHKVKPLLLVIDTHGDYDEKTHQTYLYIGEEKLYPQDLVDNRMQVPLVFLSACNTAPTYNLVNTIANGFIQCGSISVTSSYLPLGIEDSSVIYIRLLYQLAYASTHVVHKNWLSFVSHILRTSYIHSAFKQFYNDKKYKSINKSLESINTQYCAQSMDFTKRRQIYQELHQGIDVQNIQVKLTHQTPHYLMYTTIGRADLVNFECFLDKNKENVYKEVSNS